MPETTCEVCGRSTTKPTAIVIGYGGGKETRYLTCNVCASLIDSNIKNQAWLNGMKLSSQNSK